MDSGLKFNIANVPSSFVLDRDNITLRAEIERHIPSALAYSCRHWSDHLCLATPTPPDSFCDALNEFIQLKALFWMETMNLLKSAGRCQSMLRAACGWVEQVSVILN